MDDLTHQPEILFFIPGHPAHFFHKIKIQAICAVQPNSVDIKFMNPEPDHVK